MSEDTPPDAAHQRPEGVSDAVVEATGTLSEALEWVERARGRLYDFHQMMGHADLLVGQAADELEQAGASEQAEQLRTDIVGRNVIAGRWTFQIVEDFDDTYWSAVRAAERDVREALVDGRRHIFEAEMKERRRTHGAAHHESRPGLRD
jgi:hypothetical protein